MRIAIVGTGVSGLVSAHLLSRQHEVTVFEAEDRPGGHAHTVRVDLTDETHEVDTGFLVYNDRNYPGLVRLFEQLGVATKASDMSFGVTDDISGIEWRGTSFATVFAQRRNVLRPSFLRMLADVARFNRTARGLLAGAPDLTVSLADLLETGRWSSQFVDWYLIPMGSSIWSADPRTFLEMPAASFARFFDNHGLLTYGDQPSWRTVVGGSRHYVDAVLAPLGDSVRLSCPVAKVTRTEEGVEIRSEGGLEQFDHVVLATHSDQALNLLSDPSTAEREVLGAIRYQPNRATLHTDTDLLPRNRRAWASWNYHRLADRADAATLTYRLRSLQGIESAHELLVTLNRDEAIREDHVLARFDYAHPVFDVPAIAAQQRHEELNGDRRTWFCGAYWGYGFHEDGVQSARNRVPSSGRGTVVTATVPYEIPEPSIGAARGPTPVRSAVYDGMVSHHRFEPVDHRFSYRIAMVYLDLAEIDLVCALHPLWSAEAANAVSYRRSDYLGDPSVPLDTAVRDLVEERSGHRPVGPIGLLTHVRTWGWLFNPISVYYCFGTDGTTVDRVVVEVTNTPWHERTAYVLPGTGSHVVDKQLHVSPFLPMDLRHRFVIGEPGTRLMLGVDDLRGDELVFSASMVLDGRTADRRALGRILWRFPLMTMRVSWGIYRQALALKRRGATFHRHPEDEAATR